mmetsp:Transcript_43529/g.105533  ORF Transcript_43529/g.105533 Transcript_43529/m.105533 type:complete len:262 (-) Transcript_43529:345-1130(-)
MAIYSSLFRTLYPIITCRRSFRVVLDVFLVKVVEVRVVQRLLRVDPVLRVVHEEPFEKVHPGGVEGIRDSLGVRSLPPDGECPVPVLELCHTRPGIFGRRTELTEDLEELVDLRITREQGTFRNHLDEDGTDRPNIDRRGVRLATQQDFRWTVPQRDDLMCEGTDGWAEGPCQTEISKLEPAVTSNEQVLRLEVPMHDTAGVAESQTPAALVKVRTDQRRRHHTVDGLHVLLQVLVEELEDKVELSILLDTVHELDDVVVC